MKKTLIIMMVLFILTAISGCGLEGANNRSDDVIKNQGRQNTESEGSIASIADTEIANNFHNEDEFIQAVLKCFEKSDFEKYYSDYYSPALLSYSKYDKYTLISNARIYMKNYNLRNFQVIDKLYSKSVENLFIYTIGNDYTDDTGKERYSEAFYWVFIENGEWVCCPKEDGNAYYDQMIEEGIFKLIQEPERKFETTETMSTEEMNELAVSLDEIAQDILRNPEQFVDTIVSVEGEVTSVFEYNGSIGISIWNRNLSTSIVYDCKINREKLSQRILEGDTVFIIGKFTGYEHDIYYDTFEVTVEALEFISEVTEEKANSYSDAYDNYLANVEEIHNKIGSVCPTCGGTGQMYIPNQYYDSAMNIWMGGYTVCSGCGGSGYIN